MLQRKILTKEQALQKLKHYCAYQERSHSEVKEKAYSFGLRKADVDELLAELIGEDYLNEERFAIQFARGKFRMNHWGRQKIISELKRKQVSDYCIKRALKEIDDDDYKEIGFRLAKKKWESIKGIGVNRFVKMSKTRNYLLQKGFEGEMISAILKKLFE